MITFDWLCGLKPMVPNIVKSEKGNAPWFDYKDRDITRLWLQLKNSYFSLLFDMMK